MNRQYPLAGEPSAGQETPLKVVIYFVWRVGKDKEAQDGIIRLMRYVMGLLTLVVAALILLAAAIALLYTMPVSWPWKVILPGGTTTVIAIVTSVRHRLRKRRNGPLTAAWPTTRPARPIAAA